MKNGSGRFASLVSTTANAGAAYTYDSGDVDDGLTVFYPADMAMMEFEPTFKEHKAGARFKLLLYHGLPAHYSIQALKVNNGPLNTLATDGKERYSLMVENDGDNVTLLFAARKPAIVVRTLMDANRVVVHKIDGVLLPNEFAEFGPAYANAPSGGKDGAMEGNQKNGATGSPLVLLFASTAGVIPCWVFLVWVSTCIFVCK